MGKHFHVLVGLCGAYMPDDNSLVRTRAQASSVAREIVRQFRDDGERVSGSARDGYYRVGENYCVEVVDCSEPACERELEESS